MIVYIFTRIFFEAFRLIPFRLLYLISDFISLFLLKIVGYRKKVVYDNLTKAFPEKTKNEINKIAIKTYRNFIDITLESFKMFTISDKEIFKRYRVINSELVDEFYEENKSVICVTGHYANWEWGASLPTHIKHKSRIIYKPITNKYLARYINKNRSRFGIELIALEETNNAFKKTSKPYFVIMIADQSPSRLTNSIWVNFLNRDTPCIHGPEAYSKNLNLPIIYLDIQRIKRGYYTAEYSKLINNPNEHKNGEITTIYMNKLEEIIKLKPEDWLWTHKRWKHKRDENGKVLKDYFYKK